MGKQINLLYFSATDTTAKVLKGIAQGMGSQAKIYDITLPSGREKEISFDKNDLVIVGAPVYAGRIPAFITEYFSKVKGNNTAAVFIALYGNRDYDDALLELKDTFEKNGFVSVAAGAFIGEHSISRKIAYNRPDEEDIKIANNFGAGIMEKLEAVSDLSNIPAIGVKGNYPYRELHPMIPIKPDTNDDCIYCGICSESCPMAAISFDDPKEIDDTKCIRCNSCVKKCPQNAKEFNNEEMKKRAEVMIANLGHIRKEPELFI
ncbi:ferredoxin [Oxobacter pfennigii]|uniref:Ferredoxin n=1 Tax=Oxobacter pfennigii TaxID=36849 RepID=A0A0P8WA86_9CLOT|nr:EFR1 family ferrodoxin [Oxobacter pfennigii]KPU45524.1 ferredoxin [Oxobacter pfennigii]